MMNKINPLINMFKLSVLDIATVPNSYSSEVRLITLSSGEKAILKIPFSKEKLIREKNMLQKLQGTLPVPKVLDYFEGNENLKGGILLSYLEGEPLSGTVYPKLAYEAGELLARLHNTSMDYFEYGEYKSLDWWDIIKARFVEWIRLCSEVLSPKILKSSMKYFEDFMATSPHSDGPCVIHMDYRPGNLMVNNGSIVGLIDFESSCGGSSDLDFTKPKLYIWDQNRSSEEAFKKGYANIRPLPENLEYILPFYLLFNGIGGIAWCVKRNKIGDDFYVENYNQIISILKL